MTWPDDTIVAVNVSPLQFQRGDILADIRGALARSGLAPNRLQIEITESLLIDTPEAPFRGRYAPSARLG